MRWRLQGFTLGILCSAALALCTFFFYVMPMQKQLTGIASQPLGMSLLWLSQPDVESYDRQLRRLASLPPYSIQALEAHSVALAQRRWPQDARQRAATQRWQGVMQSTVKAPVPGGGYFTVQQRLQRLSDELLEQERMRGGLTISYLKTAIYQMQMAMAEDVPIEALLRQLETAARNGQPVPSTLINQINDRWERVMRRYYQLTHE